MKKLGIVFATFVFVLVVSGCSNSGVTQQEQSEKSKIVQGNIVLGLSGEVSGMKDLDTFLEAVNNGKQANLQIKQYTDEGDPILQTMEYSNAIIWYTFDNSQDKFAGTNRGIKTSEYDKVIKEEDKEGIFLTFIDKNGSQNRVFICSK